MQSIIIMFDKVFFNIECLKLDKQFLSIVFSEYGNYYLLFFDITSNFLEKNIYANLLTRCDDACVVTPYLFIYMSRKNGKYFASEKNILYNMVLQLSRCIKSYP